MEHEIVTPKAPNVVLFLTKSFDAKEKGINAVHLFSPYSNLFSKKYRF